MPFDRQIDRSAFRPLRNISPKIFGPACRLLTARWRVLLAPEGISAADGRRIVRLWQCDLDGCRREATLVVVPSSGQVFRVRGMIVHSIVQRNIERRSHSGSCHKPIEKHRHMRRGRIIQASTFLAWTSNRGSTTQAFVHSVSEVSSQSDEFRFAHGTKIRRAWEVPRGICMSKSGIAWYRKLLHDV